MISLDSCAEDLKSPDYEAAILAVFKILHLRTAIISDPQNSNKVLWCLSRLITHSDTDIIEPVAWAMDHICELFPPSLEGADRANLLRIVQQSVSNPEELAQNLFLLNAYAKPVDSSMSKAFFSHDDPRVQLAASSLFCSTCKKDELDMALPYLGHPRPWFRRLCAFHLRRFGAKELYNALEAQLSNKDIYLRKMVLDALSYLPVNGSSVRILLLCSRDPVDEIRMKSLEVMGMYAHQSTKIRIQEMTDDLNIEICEKAEALLEAGTAAKVTDINLEDPMGLLY